MADRPLRTILLLLIIAGCLGAAVVITVRALRPAERNDHLPTDFPYAFIAPADDGKADAIVLWRGRVPPDTIEDGGRTLFPAWQCDNPECIRKSGGSPRVFAHGPAPAHGLCESCRTGRRDPTQVRQHLVPEAARIVEAL